MDDLFDFRRDFDGMFNRLLNSSSATDNGSAGLIVAVPPIEAWVDNEKKEYHLSVALAGVDPKDIQINLQGNDLAISGEQKTSQEKKDANYLQREIAYGRFERVITLPEGVDKGKITAEYNNGVLEIKAPFAETALPKRIEINNSSKAKTTAA
jgi:HSP20 family protein